MWLICKSLEGKLSLFILLFLILMTTQSTWDYSFAIKPFIHIHTVPLCAVLSLSYTHTLLAQLSGASLGSVSSHILAWGMEKTGIEQHTLLVNDPLFLLSPTRPYTIQYSMSLQYHKQTLCQLPVGEERNGRENRGGWKWGREERETRISCGIINDELLNGVCFPGNIWCSEISFFFLFYSSLSRTDLDFRIKSKFPLYFVFLQSHTF